MTLEHIRAELKLHTFHTLEQLLNLAEMAESRNILLLKSSSRGLSKVATRSGGIPFLPKNGAGSATTGGESLE